MPDSHSQLPRWQDGRSVLRIRHACAAAAAGRSRNFGSGPNLSQMKEHVTNPLVPLAPLNPRITGSQAPSEALRATEKRAGDQTLARPEGSKWEAGDLEQEPYCKHRIYKYLDPTALLESWLVKLSRALEKHRHQAARNPFLALLSARLFNCLKLAS